MAPKTRNAKSCEGCGIGMVRVGKGEEEECASIWCQKCWGLSVASLEDRVKELENTSGEREDSFKECCECDELRAKVVELEKYGLNSSNDRCRKLEEEKAKYKEELCRNVNLICEVTELRINEGKMNNCCLHFPLINYFSVNKIFSCKQFRDRIESKYEYLKNSYSIRHQETREDIL